MWLLRFVTVALFAAFAFTAGANGPHGNRVWIATRPCDLSQVDAARAKEAASLHLPYPDRADFADLREYALANGDHSICGEMRSKGDDGTYSGFDSFYVRLRGDIVESYEARKRAVNTCNGAARNTLYIHDAVELAS